VKTSATSSNVTFLVEVGFEKLRARVDLPDIPGAGRRLLARALDHIFIGLECQVPPSSENSPIDRDRTVVARVMTGQAPRSAVLGANPDLFQALGAAFRNPRERLAEAALSTGKCWDTIVAETEMVLAEPLSPKVRRKAKREVEQAERVRDVIYDLADHFQEVHEHHRPEPRGRGGFFREL
jgi:hypothetical protein